ncbi:MAG: DUF434 domain-containing protein [Theionarchaea archaeon]|nr:DUF434 domain-containing protein [Theionarchaea archaeon]MBU7001791.1 DUF434 domain-containing protein [Theionarchaea archaeon]MBU7022260.1 DUF434 domain-containing protein [Theionarchaea archaeon]MBU7035494.1 DUF434 domain-containing protein [Theionarchaea archaeon]MBU7041160.1 DUF434 domain-containing protein [Theionarchaea archaeon]
MSIHEATDDLRHLLNRGYRKSYALTFVCNHYQLQKEDRHFLARTVFSEEEASSIRQKKVHLERIQGQDIAIDGYNVLISTEAVLTGDALICDDSVVRDIKGIFGKYTLTDLTHRALQEIFAVLTSHSPRTATFYFDQQVSHSGDLCSLVRTHFPCTITKHVDLVLAQLNLITATSDSILIRKLDHFIDIPFEILLSKPL